MGEAVMTTRRQADGAIVIDVRGSLDAATVDVLRNSLLTTLHAEHPVTMIIDLTFVTFMDSMAFCACAAKAAIIKPAAAITRSNPAVIKRPCFISFPPGVARC